MGKGIMRGFLAYEDGKVVGWCNVDAKKNNAKIIEAYPRKNGFKIERVRDVDVARLYL
jgi:hypothetical protein